MLTYGVGSKVTPAGVGVGVVAIDDEGAIVMGAELGASGDAKIGSPHNRSPDSLCCVKNEIGRSLLESRNACSKLQLDVDESKAALNVSLWIS